MKDKVIKILEVDEENANKLLKTENCILLGVSNKSTRNEECPNETEFLYSIGQIEYGECPICKAKTLEYNINYGENSIDVRCLNKNYELPLE